MGFGAACHRRIQLDHTHIVIHTGALGAGGFGAAGAAGSIQFDEDQHTHSVDGDQDIAYLVEQEQLSKKDISTNSKGRLRKFDLRAGG